MPISTIKTYSGGVIQLLNNTGSFIEAVPSATVSRSLWTVGDGTINPTAFSSSIDGNGSTAWASNAFQFVGMTYGVNFNQKLRLNSFTMDTSNVPGDSPGTVAISASLDGMNWTTIGTTNCDTITTYTFSPPVLAKQIKLVITGTRVRYWNITEFNVNASIPADESIRINQIASIPTSQIRLYLDASNPKSYTGTGNEWLNLASSTTSGSFPSGKLASYSYALPNGGIFGFSQTQNAMTNLPYGNPNNWTLMVWVRPGRSRSFPVESTSGGAAASDYNYILYPGWGPGGAGGDSGAGLAVATNGVMIGEHQSTYAPPTLVYSTTINTWAHITAVYENKVPKLYINGTLVRTATMSTKPNVYLSDFAQGPTVGIGGNPGGGFGGFQGDLGMYVSYDRVLTATEILGAFNAHRRRFGV